MSMGTIGDRLALHIKEAGSVKVTAVTPDGVNCVVRGDSKLAHDIGLALRDYFRRTYDKTQ